MVVNVNQGHAGHFSFILNWPLLQLSSDLWTTVLRRTLSLCQLGGGGGSAPWSFNDARSSAVRSSASTDVAPG